MNVRYLQGAPAEPPSLRPEPAGAPPSLTVGHEHTAEDRAAMFLAGCDPDDAPLLAAGQGRDAHDVSSAVDALELIVILGVAVVVALLIGGFCR